MDAAANNKILFKPQLLQQLEQFAENQGLSAHQKQLHISWVLRFIRSPYGLHFGSLKKNEIERYLSHLATDCNYSPKVQAGAEKALTFFYSDFLKKNLGELNFIRQKARTSLLGRFGDQHCKAIIGYMDGSSKLMAKLAAFANLKLKEVINIRLADIDFKKNEILIRQRGGRKKFSVKIPMAIILDLRIQTIRVTSLVQQEKDRIFEEQTSQLAILAQCLEPEWQYLFPYGYSTKEKNKRANKEESKKNTSQLNQTPLTVIKNDIRVAIKAYRLTLSNQKLANTTPKSINEQLKIHHIRSELRGANFTHRKLKLKPSQTSIPFKSQFGMA